MTGKIKGKFGSDASVVRGGSLGHELATLIGGWEFEALDKDGNVKWTKKIEKNLIVNTGLDDALDKWLKGSAYTAGFYVGLTDGAPTAAAGDTMASHAGWSEVVDYSESVRQTLTLGAVSGQSVDNSASKATFSINGTTTVGGAFVTTDNTKSGTSGTLISIVDFTGGDQSLSDGDTLNITNTFALS